MDDCRRDVETELSQEIAQLCVELERCQDVLTAIGSETRLHLITGMLAAGQRNGMRVEDIASRTNLSRPTVSHHLQILKRAGIVKVRQEGTMNFYYFDADENSIDAVARALTHAVSLMLRMPDRS